MRGASLALSLLLLAAPAAARGPILGLPIDCDLGRDCFIQQYVDTDPSDAARDFTCGPLSYDGHKGTDFGLPSLAAMEAGVDVLAAAPGTVRATRDGMPDSGYSDQTAASVEGRECGNGVVIRHGDGWETQYCHLKRGSIAVRQGDRVAKGTVLGQVGMSGRTEFPHVHLSVREGDRVVDPFDPENTFSCGQAADDTLWLDPPEYRPGALLAAGFDIGVPEYDAVKAGTAGVDGPLPLGAPALVVYGYAFGGRAGDIVHLEIDGPAGVVIEHSAQLDRGQAQFFRAAGKRRPSTGWTRGTYTGTVRMERDGRTLSERRVTLRME